MIFNIQRCSIHDGEGLRTLVFFKGCPMKCAWCANPESQSFQQEIMENQNRCVGCGLCIKVCPNKAIDHNGKIDRSKCRNCNACVDICYAGSKWNVEKEYSVEDLYKEIAKDRAFYREKGGVTFSGGEPLASAEDLLKIAAKCKENNISVIIESCGFGDYEEFSPVLPYVDSMFLDIKQINSDEHEKITGVRNEVILSNIKRISEDGIPIIIRTPIIPGYTDDKENIEGISRFVRELPSVKEYELLAYHKLGESKYEALGRNYNLIAVNPPSDEEMNELTAIANGILRGTNKQCFWTKDNTKQTGNQ